MNERYVELDCVKGLAILLLILSHCLPGEGMVKTWIFSFHMPVFFVVCGILHSRKKPQGQSLSQFPSYLKKRALQLLVPYYFWGILLIVFYQALKMISGNGPAVTAQLFSLLSWQGIDSLWFIPCYMIAEMIFVFAYLRSKKELKGIIFTALFIIVFLCGIVGMPELWICRLGIICAAAIVFMILGCWIENYLHHVGILPACLFLCIGSVLAEINGFTGMSALRLNHPLLFFLNGFLISCALVSIFGMLVEKHPQRLNRLAFWGRNSIVILCTNNLLIEITRLLDYKITNNWLLNTGAGGAILLTVGIVLIEYGIIIISSNSKLGALFGKYQMFKAS